MMERLTYRTTKGEVIGNSSVADIGDILGKLAEYEDLEELIGIPLKDLTEIFRQNIPEDCKCPRKAIVLTDDDVDRWNGYKSADEQGLLLRLEKPLEESIFKEGDSKDVT